MKKLFKKVIVVLLFITTSIFSIAISLPLIAPLLEQAALGLSIIAAIMNAQNGAPETFTAKVISPQATTPSFNTNQNLQQAAFHITLEANKPTFFENQRIAYIEKQNQIYSINSYIESLIKTDKTVLHQYAADLESQVKIICGAFSNNPIIRLKSRIACSQMGTLYGPHYDKIQKVLYRVHQSFCDNKGNIVSLNISPQDTKELAFILRTIFKDDDANYETFLKYAADAGVPDMLELYHQENNAPYTTGKDPRSFFNIRKSSLPEKALNSDVNKTLHEIAVLIEQNKFDEAQVLSKKFSTCTSDQEKKAHFILQASCHNLRQEREKIISQCAPEINKPKIPQRGPCLPEQTFKPRPCNHSLIHYKNDPLLKEISYDIKDLPIPDREKIEELLVLRLETVDKLAEALHVSHAKLDLVRPYLYHYIDKLHSNYEFIQEFNKILLNQHLGNNKFLKCSFFNQHGVLNIFYGTTEYNNFTLNESLPWATRCHISSNINHLLSLKESAITNGHYYHYGLAIDHINAAGQARTQEEAFTFTYLAEGLYEALIGNKHYEHFLHDIPQAQSFQNKKEQALSIYKLKVQEHYSTSINQSITIQDQDIQKGSSHTFPIHQDNAPKTLTQTTECPKKLSQEEIERLEKLIKEFNESPGAKKAGIQITIETLEHTIHGHITNGQKKGVHFEEGACCTEIQIIKTAPNGDSYGNIIYNGERKSSTFFGESIEIILEKITAALEKSEPIIFEDSGVPKMHIVDGNSCIELRLTRNKKTIESFYPAIKYLF